jgi:hypothetical protein
MKKILFILLGLALYISGAPNSMTQIIEDNKGQSVALFGSQRNTAPSMNAVVNLDTSEIDTSYYGYNMIDKPIIGNLDTLGFLHFDYKDSTGTDSCRVRVIWYGNSRPDGQGIWNKIDSVTASASGAAASSYQSATPTAVVNSKRYMAFMFTIGNPSNSAVGLKSVAKNIVLNRAARIGQYQQ